MRVTQNMMSNMFVSNLRRQTEAMAQRQEQIATQKRINRPSDDPGGMGRVLAGRSELSAIEQYAYNIVQGKARLEASEEVLSLVDGLIAQAQSIAEANGGAGKTASERELAAEQVKEIYDQVLQLGNSKFGGRYLFAGDQNDSAPFTRDDDYAATYHGDGGSFKLSISDHAVVTIDADGRNYFQDAADGGVNIFDELRALIDGLENSDVAVGSTQISATVDSLEEARVQIMNKRTEAAPKLYRLEATERYLSNVKTSVQDRIAGAEDADTAQAVIELKNLETAYESTLEAASRIIQPSLVNFLS